MIGARIEYEGDGLPAPGTYWRDSRTGTWGANTPNDHLANLSAHTVVEHEDGTLSVQPSILVSYPHRGVPVWHGYLERGVWRELPL